MLFPAAALGRTLLNMAVQTAAAEPNASVVVLTGLVLVFAILVLLSLIFTFTGKLFSSLDKKRQAAQATEGASPAAPSPQAAPSAAPQAAPPLAAAPAPQAAAVAAIAAATQAAAPAVPAGIPPEIVAAIAAAVASVDDGRYVLQSVTATAAPPPQKGRGQWGLAGVISYTEPF